MEFYKDSRVIVNPLRIKDSIINEIENSLVLYYSGASRESAAIIGEQIRNAQTGDALAIAAMHKVKSNALSMKENLLRGNVAEFAGCLGASWESKKGMASSITNPEIEKIFTLAMNNGAVAGKVSGAGGGGYMMFMTDPVNRLKLVRALNGHNGSVSNIHFERNGVQSWVAERS
jgi:D-glycero-alpha-D-manno-heptose-7-phosphate kinase